MEIRIRDNGTGIPPEVKEKMFNPFFTTKPAGEGTGLGLSISHDIVVKQHAGPIEVETEPGEFTEFRIILPRQARRLPNREHALEPSYSRGGRRTRRRGAVSSAVPARPPRRSLQNGICPVGAYGAATHQDAADVSLILILSDINMPGMSGLELLPKAKAARPDVPVIMITAYGDADTKRKALENGAERFSPSRSTLGRCAARSIYALSALLEETLGSISHVRFWHLADIRGCTAHVRFGG